MLWSPTKGCTLTEMGEASVTTGAAATSKGTPAQLIASTARDTHMLVVTIFGYAAAATTSSLAVDILLGGATESVFIPNLLGGGAGVKSWYFPVYIPSGTRIAAQAAGARTSTAFTTQVRCINYPGGAPFQVGSVVTTYGIGTLPNGTTITPGASGAEGNYAQITASTTMDHFAIMPSFQLGTDTTTNLRYIEVDIGVGDATEDVISADWVFHTTGNEEMGGSVWPHFCRYPSGTRLALRASNSGTNDGAYNAVIHCIS